MYSANWLLISFASNYHSDFESCESDKWGIWENGKWIYELMLAYISRSDWKNNTFIRAPDTSTSDQIHRGFVHTFTTNAEKSRSGCTKRIGFDERVYWIFSWASIHISSKYIIHLTWCLNSFGIVERWRILQISTLINSNFRL